MKHKVTLIPGEGIGPEVASATRRVLEAAGVQIDWEEIAGREGASSDQGQVVNQAAVDSVRKNRVALKGPMATAIAGGAPSVNVALRKTLDLYANLRPVRNLPGVKSHFENVDLVLVRENTEDLYSGLEHEVVPGVVESLKIITERASTRIARFAFQYAKLHGRKKIHAIHKANIMKLSDGLFLKSVRRNRVALKGPMATAIAGGAPSVNVALRKTLDLYANLRPVKNVPGVKSHFENVDLILVRENTEDLYSGLEHEVVPGVVESLKIITEKASTRIAKFAFEYAKCHGRKRIHAIHKANIMKLSDGLFLKSVRAVAAKFQK